LLHFKRKAKTMFERLKKVFVAGKADAGDSAASDEAVSEWAGTRGFSFTGMGKGKGFALKGSVGNKPWKMERPRLRATTSAAKSCAPGARSRSMTTSRSWS
jgi:hypothetical protein